MINNKKIILLLAVTAFVFAAGFYLFREPFLEVSRENAARPFVTIGTKNVFVDLAVSEEEWTRGLSGRLSLGEDEGMIFLFPEARLSAFWMKGMNFPIDIIWISEGKIVGIERDVLPQPGVSEGELRTYFSPEPVTAVLEINAGKAEEWGVKRGDNINFKF